MTETMVGQAVAGAAGSMSAYDVEAIRREFPILNREVHGKPLVYLDNAATTQKPNRVIDRIREYYVGENANIHRGVHYLSQIATDYYEQARVRLQQFVNAPSSKEIIFTRGCTEGINLVASSFGRANVKAGDEVVISAMEHHSNIVPWQLLCEQVGAHLRVIPMTDRGELIMEEYETLLTPRTRIVGVNHVSNALGTINPIKEMVRLAHERGIPVLVDGAQSTPHMKVDVQDLDCDFYAFSGHKMYGPTGIGVLYGKEKLLNAMPPYQGGGDMILSVTFEKTLFNTLPHKFEAGTPHIEGVIGLGAAADYLDSVGLDRIAAHEADLLGYGTGLLTRMPGLRMIGTAEHKAGVLSFVIEGLHPHDLGTVLDMEGVAIRTGHHCAQPVMERFDIPATARASLAMYNTRQELDLLAAAIQKAIGMFL